MNKPARKETSKRKTYSAPALEKGLDILELLANEAAGLSISEIKEKLNRSVGELFRMLVVLEQRGYIALESGTDKYTLTLKMFNLSHKFPPIKRLTSVSSAVLRNLSYEIEQSCHVVIYYEGRGHVIAQQDSPSARIFSVRLGAEAALMNTCSGHLLLAYSDESTRKQMLSRIPPYHPNYDKQELEKIIRRILSQGYENLKSAQAHGVQDIGYPIFDYQDKVVAALVVPFFEFYDDAASKDMEEIHAAIAMAARSISVSLGYEPD